ncbi:hypothetical protein [Methylobacterium fujisawaense]
MEFGLLLVQSSVVIVAPSMEMSDCPAGYRISVLLTRMATTAMTETEVADDRNDAALFNNRRNVRLRYRLFETGKSPHINPTMPPVVVSASSFGASIWTSR